LKIKKNINIDDQLLAAIDIGAGLGTKIAIAGLKDFRTGCLCEKLLHQQEYGTDPLRFIQKLAHTLKKMMASCGLDFARLDSIGVSIPGFSDDTQKIISCNNLPFLDHCDIKGPLSCACGADVSIINDGDCGALAQWNVHRCELLYWTFGGGWGGSWISREGSVQFPNINWDGQDRTIHITNEPGYVSKITKKELGDIFKDYGASWDLFLENYAREVALEPCRVAGPDNDTNALRAETCVSGKGLWRIYHAFITKDDLDHVPEDAKNHLLNPGTAGPMIFKQYVKGDRTARKAVSLFARIFGEAAVDILKKIKCDGAAFDIPVYLGGGLSKSFDLFVPKVRQVLDKAGVKSEIRPCHFLKTGQNANLIGAFCLAAKNSFMLENIELKKG